MTAEHLAALERAIDVLGLVEVLVDRRNGYSSDEVARHVRRLVAADLDRDIVTLQDLVRVQAPDVPRHP